MQACYQQCRFKKFGATGSLKTSDDLSFACQTFRGENQKLKNPKIGVGLFSPPAEAPLNRWAPRHVPDDLPTHRLIVYYRRHIAPKVDVVPESMLGGVTSSYHRTSVRNEL